MDISNWEKHTLLADIAMKEHDHLRSILHYQQALTVSEQISQSEEIDVEDRLITSVISCHKPCLILAYYW